MFDMFVCMHASLHNRYCISRFEAGESAHGLERLPEDDRLRIRQEVSFHEERPEAGQDLHPVRHPGVPGPRNCHLQRVMTSYLYINDCIRIHTFQFPWHPCGLPGTTRAWTIGPWAAWSTSCFWHELLFKQITQPRYSRTSSPQIRCSNSPPAWIRNM